MSVLPLDAFFSMSVQKYYQNRELCIGDIGDFTTAPEISQLFCQAVGVWVYNVAHRYTSVSLVELGPGHGTLMSEIITFLKRAIKIKDVFFIESSAKMIEKQKHSVAKHNEINFHWMSYIEQLPVDMQYIFIANEFFDALPIKQFIKHHDNFYEIFVSEDLHLIRSYDPINHNQMLQIMKYSNTKPDQFVDGDIFELSTISLTTLQRICDLCSAALIIDYGYGISKKISTVKAISNHKILDQFVVKPGSADISAQVDFGALENFVQSNYTTYKTHYSTQSGFLDRHQIAALAEKARLHSVNQSEILSLENEIKTISVDMGTIFKVFEIYR